MVRHAQRLPDAAVLPSRFLKMADLYLSAKGLADMKKRVSKAEADRLDALVKEGKIKIIGAGKKDASE